MGGPGLSRYVRWETQGARELRGASRTQEKPLSVNAVTKNVRRDSGYTSTDVASEVPETVLSTSRTLRANGAKAKETWSRAPH